MFVAARNRNETVSLVRFAGDASASDAAVEIERAGIPSKELALAWLERAQRAAEGSHGVRYGVRFFRDGRSTGTYALPAVVRMPAMTPDEVECEEAARQATAETDRLRTAAACGYRLGKALARGKP
jgi:hypothetical protein